ncbi:hypothetical protein CDAR_570971 [Caerostris darwini]|uniref:Uncharacterized protein n=1 Tax=Caerostris darwini TaxID=1538125 RepID=A0AAV4P2U4_9ARAC|nr:hypothetical protein CDAR_570971 [Caerostris darwini]
MRWQEICTHMKLFQKIKSRLASDRYSRARQQTRNMRGEHFECGVKSLPELQLQCSRGNKRKYKNFLLLTHVSIHLGFCVDNHSGSDFFVGCMTSLK